MNEVQSISCKTTFHPRFNTSRGLNFLSEFDIDDVQLFKEVLTVWLEINCMENPYCLFVCVFFLVIISIVVTFLIVDLKHARYFDV